MATIRLVPAVEDDDLHSAERNEGFAEARVWFDENPAIRQVSEAGRAALGRVLLGQSHWRLEAIGGERLARLRNVFEARLGEKVHFAGAAPSQPTRLPFAPARPTPLLLKERSASGTSTPVRRRCSGLWRAICA